MNVDVVICSYNRHKILEQCLTALENHKSKHEFNVVVVDDGSAEPIKSSFAHIIRNKYNEGWAASKNKGIKYGKGEMVVLLDDDIVVEDGWLDYILESFESNHDKDLGAVSTVSNHAGHSIAYRRMVFTMCGYFDIKFRRNLRQDTDFNWRIMDRGWRIRVLEKPMFQHAHPSPTTIHAKVKFFWSRTLNHENDVLLAKKHTLRYKNYFDVKLGFIRNPVEDFKNATGIWGDSGKTFQLSSPHGVVLSKNKLLTLIMGLSYVIIVKFVRLYGSLKYGFLMI